MEMIIIYGLCAICLLLFIIIIVQSLVHALENKAHRSERRDLYDRIMSGGNVRDYKILSDETKREEPHLSAHRRAMNAWRDPKGGGS